MTPRVLFAAGDVGGGRALLPVMEACAARGVSYAAVRHGYFADHEDLESAVTPVLSLGRSDPDSVQLPTDVVAFSGSVADTFALSLARRAETEGLRTLHLLDNWSSYRRRLEHDGQPMFHPDRYAVMDELARDAAVEAGVDVATVIITGQPALAELATAEVPKRTPGRLRIAFISEPAAQDQGPDPRSPNFRGYTETRVLELFCAAAKDVELEVWIQPHPREDEELLMAAWQRHRGSLDGKRSPFACGRDAVLAADAVVGMASILLYEAWLLGKPVLSIQPELCQSELRWVGSRPGVFFADRSDQVGAAVAEWLAHAARATRQPQPDLARHQHAPEAVLDAIESLFVVAKGAAS